MNSFKIYFFNLFIFTFNAQINSYDLKAGTCPKTFKFSSSYDFESNELLRYLNELHEKNFLSEQSIQTFVDLLKKGVLINPISDADANVSAEAYVQRQTIETLISNSKGINEKLILWGEEILQNNSEYEVRSKEIKQLTLSKHRPMQFHPIEVRRRLFDFPTPKIFSTSHTIEVMSTPVTQMQWFEIMGDNPSLFKNGPESIKVKNSEGKHFNILPDHPVENFTTLSALVFANKLSLIHNLQPSYEINALCLDPETNTAIRQLNLSTPLIDPIDHYSCEGFRLPFGNEQSFLLGLETRYIKQAYYFGSNPAELIDHAWFHENSSSITHPVAELHPRILQGFEFYDLLGNVDEIGHKDKIPIYSRRYHREPDGRYFTKRGGYHESQGFQLSLYYYFSLCDHGSITPTSRGLRLVRTLHR